MKYLTLVIFLSIGQVQADDHFQKIMQLLSHGEYSEAHKELADASWLGFKDDNDKKLETNDFRRNISDLENNDNGCSSDLEKMKKDLVKLNAEIDECFVNNFIGCKALLYTRKTPKGERTYGFFGTMNESLKKCATESSYFRQSVQLFQARTSISLEILDLKYKKDFESLMVQAEEKVNKLEENYAKKNDSLMAGLKKEAKENEKPNAIKAVCDGYRRIKDLNQMLAEEKRVEKISGVTNLTKRESIGREIVGYENWIDVSKGNLKSKFGHSFSQKDCK